jgi:hypothetical protein
MLNTKLTPKVDSSLLSRINSNSLLLVSILLSLASWVILIFQMPVLQNLEHWFWPLNTLEDPQYGWIIPILVLNFAVLAIVVNVPKKIILNLVLLILAGYATQHMFALVEGRGLDGLRDRLINTGHADFAIDAASPPSITRVMRDYRTMIDSGELHRYPHSTKPPGHFVVYILTGRLAAILTGIHPDVFERLATLTAFFFPLLTYLTLIPLFFLARLYLPQRQAHLPLILFMAAPNLNLITLHLDQVLYPFLFLLPITLYLYGFKRQNKTLLLLSGLSMAGIIYVSYSLIAVIAVVGLLGLMAIWKERPAFTPAIKSLVQVAIGFLVFELFQYFVFGFNLLGDYRYVMAQHQAWKVSQWTAPLTLYIGALDLLEYALWIGWPIFLFSASWMLKSPFRWRKTETYSLALIVLVSLLLLAFFGKTVAETARLWIFLLPCLALFAVQDLIERYPKSFPRVFALILGLQLLSTLAIKLFQDFY